MTENWRNRIIGHAVEAPDQLLANPMNWRIHPKAQQEALTQVLDRVGWVQDVIVNQRTGHVVDGHLRVSVAISRNEPGVPVVYVELDEEEERLILASLDPLASMAVTDEEMLAQLVAGIETEGELAALLERTSGGGPKEGLTDPDAVPEPPDEPVTRLGDLWVMGNHRLLCGDSTKGEDVARLSGGETPEIVFTSPPYLQQREYGDAALTWDWLALMNGVSAQFPSGAQVLVNLGLVHRDGRVVRYWDDWINAMDSNDWRLFGWYVWDKISATFKANDGRPYIAHEWVFHFNRESQPTREWVPTKHGGEQRSVWGQRKPDGHVAALSTPGRIKDFKPPDSIARIQRETNNSDASVRSHPARFPVAFAEYWVTSWPGDVYDPFLGSGTTLIAAERLGRRCYAMEIEPRYVDVAVKRWEDYTGQKAVLDGR
jgi:DNA modification methylase